MGDIQDDLSHLIPQSCIPTFEEMESWTDRDVEQVRAWIAGGARGRTPDVFVPVVNAYYAPRPSNAVRAPEEFYETQRILAGRAYREDLDAMDFARFGYEKAGNP